MIFDLFADSLPVQWDNQGLHRMVPHIRKKQKMPLAHPECPRSDISRLCNPTTESHTFWLDQVLPLYAKSLLPALSSAEGDALGNTSPSCYVSSVWYEPGVMKALLNDSNYFQILAGMEE